MGDPAAVETVMGVKGKLENGSGGIGDGEQTVFPSNSAIKVQRETELVVIGGVVIRGSTCYVLF